MLPQTDLNQREFRTHIRAVEQRGKLQKLRRPEGAPDADPEVEQLAVDYAHVTGSANFLLAGWDCPPDEHRAFIDALVGAAGERVRFAAWFSATDEVIARHAGRSTKWVQDHRKDFIAWMKRSKKSVIEIEDNWIDREGARHAHRYRVHLPRVAAEAALNAQRSNKWFENPGMALEEAAETMSNALPDGKPHRRRKGPSRPDAARQIKSSLNFARTKISKAISINELTGNNVQIDFEMLEAIAQMEEKLSALKALAKEQAERAGDECSFSSTLKNKEAVENCRETPPEETPPEAASGWGVVEKISTLNCPVESTTYAKTDEKTEANSDVSEPRVSPVEAEFDSVEVEELAERLEHETGLPPGECRERAKQTLLPFWRGPATWTYTVGDELHVESVTIVGDLGLSTDGRRYVRVQEQQLRVRLDELT